MTPTHSKVFWGQSKEHATPQVRKLLGFGDIATTYHDDKKQDHALTPDAIKAIDEILAARVDQVDDDHRDHITAEQVVAHLRHVNVDYNAIQMPAFG